MSILLGSWVKVKQSRQSSQVPFLIAAVIECNRFTAATVRQDTFSWYPFEWNDLTKWNLSPIAVEPLTREIAYSLNEYFQWCTNFCQSQTKMNEPIIIVSIEYIPNLFFFCWRIYQCLQCTTNASLLIHFVQISWCAMYSPTDVMPRFEKYIYAFQHDKKKHGDNLGKKSRSTAFYANWLE